MKRLVLLSGVVSLAALAVPSSASAEPGIVYVPSDPIDLVPTSECPVPQGGQPNTALGCGGVSAAATIDPYGGDASALLDGLKAGVEPYDIQITDVRPPEYIAYFMLMATTDTDDESLDHDCVSAGINCGGRARNGFAFPNGGTMNCMMPDPVHASLYAIGRLCGLEGTDDAMSVMGYVPDYTMPQTSFGTTCANLVQQIGFNDMDEEITLPLECTSLDHEPCDMDDQQNDDADLLAHFGARVEDTDAPVFSNITPEDGATLAPGELVLDVDIEDADPIVGVRWTITSPVLEDAGIEGGTVCKATNNVCANPMNGSTLTWDEGVLKPTDSDWVVSEFADAPGGDYTITLEASDYHGNVTETVTINVTVEGGGSVDESGGDDMADGTAGGDDGTAGGDDGSVFTSGGMDDGTGGGDDGGDANASDDGDTSGCSCSTTPANGAFGLLIFGLFGLGLRRRD